MKRLLLLAVPLLFLGCGGEPLTEPASDTDAQSTATFARVRVTNTIEIQGSCAHGVEGDLLYVIVPTPGAIVRVPCSSGVTTTVNLTGQDGIFLWYDIEGAHWNCNEAIYYEKSLFPLRDKCYATGRDGGDYSGKGKALAKFTVVYQ